MPDPQQPSQLAGLLGTARGKFIGALVVIVLLLSIVELGITIRTSYFNMLTAQAQSEAATAKVIDPATVAPKLAPAGSVAPLTPEEKPQCIQMKLDCEL